MRCNIFAVLFLALAAGCVQHQAVRPAPAETGISEKASNRRPGAQPDGSMLLPNQWSLRPTGTQIELGDFPVNVALHPGGRFAAVLHSGYSTNAVVIVDLSSLKVVSRARIKQGFYGVTFSRDGRRLFCSGAGEEVIHSYPFENGKLGDDMPIRLRELQVRGVPSGLAVDRAGRTLFAANVWGDSVSRVDLKTGQVTDEIHLRTNSAPLLRASPGIKDEDVLAAKKRADIGLIESSIDNSFPYACCLDERRGRLYVTLWGEAEIAVIDLRSNTVVEHWQAQEHPCEMVLNKSGTRLYVANANRNTVSVFDTSSGKSIETIWAALFPDAPSGSTPNSVALSPDEKTLFVANADNNFVAVFDVSNSGKSVALGFIPTGWYPTSVRMTLDGKHLLVANGKGLGSRANPNGPQPIPGRVKSTEEYIARLFPGTLSVIDLPPRSQLEAFLKPLTANAYRLSPLKAGSVISAKRAADNPVPARPGQPSPIKYVFYIIKENRTYDQVFGDISKGNGDASLCLFPEQVTPNLHKLVSEFVLLDNFYADAEISADGHEWSMGAYATDFVEKSWPMMYGHNDPNKYPFPAEGNFDIAAPAGGYLWDRAKAAGVSYRSYGEFAHGAGESNSPTKTLVKSLKGHIDPFYPGFDLDISDFRRSTRLISELNRLIAEGNVPRLQIIRLPNDHTHGVSRGKRVPKAYVAENDLALGQIVEAISHSKIWPESAIFVVEDDAQNGPDHVDAHRTVALVISPYTKSGAVDSSMYSTSSMLRTIELILGLQPMSQFDASARPMYNSFRSTPDLTPYIALPANINLEEKNDSHAWGNNIEMNFAKEDAADDLLLNEVIWRSVRGAHSPMPAPTRAAFVFGKTTGDDD